MTTPHFAYKDSERFYALSPNEAHLRLNCSFWAQTECTYCQTSVELWGAQARMQSRDPVEEGDYWSRLRICSACGWWRCMQWVMWSNMDWYHEVAILKKFQTGTADAPLAEIRDLLKNDWRYSKHISPAKAEDLVASIFKEHLDCEVVYLTNSVFAPDRGIDFVLVSKATGEEIAFQVKRRQTDAPEPVQEVRAFLGALTLSRYDTGFYVTTAERYTRTVHQELAEGQDFLKGRNIKLELVDGTRLREMLRLDQVDRATIIRLKNAVFLSENWRKLENSHSDTPLEGGIPLDMLLQKVGMATEES